MNRYISAKRKRSAEEDAADEPADAGFVAQQAAATRNILRRLALDSRVSVRIEQQPQELQQQQQRHHQAPAAQVPALISAAMAANTLQLA